MNNILSKIRTIGIKRSVDILFNYKFNKALQKGITLLTKKLPLKNIIIIESHNDFDCNGGAFYEYLIEQGYNTQYLIVWLIKNDRKYYNLPKNVITLPLRRLSIRRDYYISRARYFTSDNEITDKVRDDQISIFFDHGPFGLKNVKPFYHLSDTVDYFLSSSKNYDPIYCNQLSRPYPNEKMVHLGYPMHDVFYKDTENELKKISKKNSSKVILWMPTFRKGGGAKRNDSIKDYPFEVPLIEKKEQLDKINEILSAENIFLIIKLHPMQRINPDNELFKYKSDQIVVLTGDDIKKNQIDNYRLLKNVDALISDYSSIAYSFILLDKPVAFVLSDSSDLKYGYSVDNPEFFLAGHHIYTIYDFIEFLKDISLGKDIYRRQRNELCNWLYEYKDGNSCERIVRFLGI